MPTLTASFLPAYTYPGTVFTPTWSWQAIFSLTVPFYDDGLRDGLARERKSLVREAQLAREDALRRSHADLPVGNEATQRTEVQLGRAGDADTNAAIAEDQARQARLDLLFATGLMP